MYVYVQVYAYVSIWLANIPLPCKYKSIHIHINTSHLTHTRKHIQTHTQLYTSIPIHATILNSPMWLSGIPAYRKYTVIRDPKLSTVMNKKAYATMTKAHPLAANSSSPSTLTRQLQLELWGLSVAMLSKSSLISVWDGAILLSLCSRMARAGKDP